MVTGFAKVGCGRYRCGNCERIVLSHIANDRITVSCECGRYNIFYFNSKTEEYFPGRPKRGG